MNCNPPGSSALGFPRQKYSNGSFWLWEWTLVPELSFVSHSRLRNRGKDKPPQGKSPTVLFISENSEWNARGIQSLRPRRNECLITELPKSNTIANGGFHTIYNQILYSRQWIWWLGSKRKSTWVKLMIQGINPNNLQNIVFWNKIYI